MIIIRKHNFFSATSSKTQRVGEMPRNQGQASFVLSAQQPVLLQTGSAQLSCPALAFNLVTAPLPFAWIGNGRLAQLPFARVGSSSIWDPPASADTLMKQLLSEEPDEPQGPRRGHTDDWYQARCIFCASCKSTINSHYQKRGSRCQGCRRWFHAACMPATSPSSPAAAAADAEPAAAEQNGRTAAGTPASSSSSSGKAGRKRRSLFFHDEDCQQVYDQLAQIAAAGDRPFTLPDQRPFWQRLFSPQQPPHEQHCWRLLDLSEVRSLYKDAQKRETLFKQHSKVLRQLEGAAEAAAEREAAKRNKGFGFGSSSSSTSGGPSGPEGGGGGVSGSGVGGSKRSVRSSSLDDFLVVSEVLKPLGETPRDLLEDSYAIITREGSNGPSAVATFNVYGSDHARLQGVATPAYLQKQGHATRLLQQLEVLLADAGVQELVVILEPADNKPKKPHIHLLSPDAAQHWFRRRLGFRPASSEQQMLWRRELPEYHKGLIGGCSLLVKPLLTPAAMKAAGKKA